MALFGDVTPQGLGTNYQTRENGNEGGGGVVLKRIIPTLKQL